MVLNLSVKTINELRDSLDVVGLFIYRTKPQNVGDRCHAQYLDDLGLNNVLNPKAWHDNLVSHHGFVLFG